MNNFEARIDSVFSIWQGTDCPGGQVLVKHKGEVIYNKNFGAANIEHGVAVSGDTVFHVASVSKQFTVMCAMILAEKGLLDINADVRDYVPDLICFDEPVTVRNLMNNISGIRDQWELLMLSGVRIDDTITMRDLKTMIGMQTALNFEPCEKYMYSNSNFTLLSEIIERISGKSFVDFASEKIFQPLDMNKTLVKDDCTKIVKNLAYSYDDNGEGAFSYHGLNYSVSGATSLHTTASDLMIFLENYAEPKACTKQTVDFMRETPTLTSGEKSSYGAGLMVGNYNGHDYFEHSGADAAYRANVITFPTDELNIVILSNTQSISPPAASRKIAEIVLGISQSKVESPADCSNAKAGIYYALEPDILRFDVCERGSDFYFGSEKNSPQLHLQSDGGYSVGYLSNKFYFGASPSFVTQTTSTKLNFAEEVAQDTQALLAFEGTYESDELATRYYIMEQDGFLDICHPRNGKSRLIKIGRDKYLVRIGEMDCVAHFLRGAGSRVLGMSLDCGRVKHLGFTRVEG